MSRCGIWQRSETRLRPIKSFPRASVNFEGELTNSADSICSQGDGLPVGVRDFDSNRRFSRDALDQNGFRLEREAQIVGKAGDAAVLDARFRLELVCGHNGARIDLRYAAADVKLLALLLDGMRAFLEFVLFDFFVARRRPQQIRGGKAEAG